MLKKRKSIIEEKKQVDELSLKYKNLNEQQAQTEEAITASTVEWIGNISGGFGSISQTLSGVNKELSETFSEISEITNAIGSIVEGLSSGNYIQVAASAFELAVKTLDKLNDNTSANESTLALIELQNKELEKQVKLLDEARGADIYIGLQSAIKGVDEALQETTEQMEALNTQTDAVKESGGINNIVALANQNAAGGIDDVTEALKNLELQQDELLEQRASILDKFFQKFTGTTSDSIADSILAGFEKGEDGLVQFANTFEELMKDSLLETFKLEFLQKQFDSFYEEFGLAAQDGLDKNEIEKLSKLFNTKVDTAQAGFEELDLLYNSVFGKGINEVSENDVDKLPEAETPIIEPVSQGGDIRASITEETGTILSGRIGAVVLSNEKLVNQGLDMLDYAVRNLQYQKQIAANTDYLPAIEENTRKMNEKL